MHACVCRGASENRRAFNLTTIEEIAANITVVTPTAAAILLEVLVKSVDQPQLAARAIKRRAPRRVTQKDMHCAQPLPAPARLDSMGRARTGAAIPASSETRRAMAKFVA